MTCRSTTPDRRRAGGSPATQALPCRTTPPAAPPPPPRVASCCRAPRARVRPVLDVRGSRVVHAGERPGAGHVVKALNNLMSAAHLLVSSEALIAGREFGLDPAVMLDIVNGSSGRSGSTQTKWPRFILPGGFDSGFALRLMLKDMRGALDLQDATGTPAPLSRAAVDAWADAAEALPPDADHTEIARWLEQRRAAGPARTGE